MKKLYVLLIGLFLSFTGFSQSCLPYGIEFTTQSQIDSFQINYPGCTQIEGQILVGIWGGNPTDITNLDGLDVLTGVGGYFLIFGNPNLTSLSGLEGINSIGGDLYLGENNALTSLAGLDNLDSIGGTLYIIANENLVGLEGLNNLTYVGGYLEIGNDPDGGNPNLASLSALSNLTHLQGGQLIVYGNESLTSLTGLDNIEQTGQLSITYNSSLSTCNVESICNWVLNTTGGSEIHDNASGCDSEAEVEAACGLGVGDNSLQISQISFYPNPSTTALTIDLTNVNTIRNNTFLSIYNITGQQIIRSKVMGLHISVDVSGLISGLYFVKVVSDDGIRVGKFVKR